LEEATSASVLCLGKTCWQLNFYSEIMAPPHSIPPSFIRGGGLQQTRRVGEGMANLPATLGSSRGDFNSLRGHLGKHKRGPTDFGIPKGRVHPLLRTSITNASSRGDSGCVAARRVLAIALFLGRQCIAYLPHATPGSWL